MLWFALFALLFLGLLWRASLLYVQAKAVAELERVSSIQVGELDRQLDQYSFIPKLLADDVEIMLALQSTSVDAINAANRRLSKTRKDSGLDIVFLLDQQGQTIASSNYAEPVSFVGINYGFRPYFKQAITGESATYFAVGATTGIPGYFIAEPVEKQGLVYGVVVSKIDLQVVVNSWTEFGYVSYLSDEFGVVILSSLPELLYSRTEPLSQSAVTQLRAERRYITIPAVVEPVPGKQSYLRLHSAEGSSLQVFADASLTSEPWRFSTLLSLQKLHRQSASIVLAICSALLILYLLLRVYSQQRRIVATQKRNALELEELVTQRTHELAAAQKRLIAESNFAMLGRMSAAINHEINQPLASLRFNLASLRKLISNSGTSDPEIEQTVIDSDRTTKRIGRVISSLRSVAGNRKADFKSVSIKHIMDEVFVTINRERPVASTSVSTIGNIPAVGVVGDEVQIQQALLNLLYNAFDAVSSSDNPAIGLLVCLADIKEPSVLANVHTSVSNQLPADAIVPGSDFVLISIVDNGAGVDQQALGTLFEPFTSSRRYDHGLGLGLTLSLQIAQDHGGELFYCSPLHMQAWFNEHDLHHSNAMKSQAQFLLSTVNQYASCFTLVLPVQTSNTITSAGLNADDG